MGEYADDAWDPGDRYSWFNSLEHHTKPKGYKKRMTIAYITGACRWAKVGNGTPATFDEFKGKKSWAISVELDKEGRKQVRELGLKLKLHEDNEGRFWVNFRRPFEKNFGKGVEQLSPPEVFDQEGRDYSKILIGNESNVTVKIQTYQTTFTDPETKVKENVVGHRLDAVRVNKLEEYTKPEGETDGGFPPVTTGVEQTKKEPVRSKKSEIVEDSIPF